VKFFELNTHRGYASKNDGDFEYDEVRKTGRPAPENEYAWSPTKCPPEVIEAFRHFISDSGTYPHQIVCAAVTS
jgi:hypothetical protein